jgi:hypothetical protein
MSAKPKGGGAPAPKPKPKLTYKQRLARIQSARAPPFPPFATSFVQCLFLASRNNTVISRPSQRASVEGRLTGCLPPPTLRTPKRMCWALRVSSGVVPHV